VVNLVVRASARNRNTYQGSLGFGTDTDFRAQVLWTRHLLSQRGDSLEMGLGWQQRFNQYSFKTGYRLPRRVKAREFWIADLGVRKENQDFEVKANDDDPDFVKLTNGDVIDYSFKAGKLIVRDLSRGYQQLFESWYAQYVFEKSTFSLSDLNQQNNLDPDVSADLQQFRETDSSLALGVNWDWPVARGSGFGSTGHHSRAWIFTANKVWGSNREFTQAYLYSNWSKLLGRKWKLLLRGEVGYSDASTQDLQIDVDNLVLDLSVTDLPSLYRFKAGGSRSVRGYAFESLSNNGIGSNNIVTASAEIEWNFRPDWALATFYDVGNAFNDWGQTNLKHGAGVGVRWYSIAGPIRLDFAQALSYDGDPWRIHFTIGTPLL
jgi:translocation and assembly module TamA